MVSALGKNIPVFESPLGLIDGILVLPAETVKIPLTFKLPLESAAVNLVPLEGSSSVLFPAALGAAISTYPLESPTIRILAIIVF
jgi:hypothetical protein